MTRLIDADALDAEMYHKSFEVDDGRNVWNSGLWIRYKIFEEAIRDAPTVDAVPVTLINGRINDLKNMLINTDDDEKDEIWHLRTEIQTLKELLEMWAERKEE